MAKKKSPPKGSIFFCHPCVLSLRSALFAKKLFNSKFTIP